MGIISTQLSESATLATNGLIPVGEVIHKNCTKMSANGNTWTVRSTGYYKATAFVTVAPTAAGDITVSLNVDGSPVATGFGTTETNGDSVTIPIQYVGLIQCGCATDRLTLSVSVASTVSESDVVIERM